MSENLSTLPELITTATVRGIASQTISELTQSFKIIYSSHKALKQLSINNDDLVASIAKLMNVKTLFTGADRSSNLFDFFLQPKLENAEGNIFYIENINTLNNSSDYIFQGTVGQGKSIYMRYLAIQDLITNSKIPLFIELKNISKSKDLIFLMKEYLKVWVKNDDDIFDKILKSGKISLYLDAFDEIDAEYVQDTYSTINHLSQNYYNLNVIVSTRPNTIITHSPFFDILSLQPYELEEQVKLINKLVKNKNNVDFLVNSIKTSSHEVKEVLTTPLMVVLFINQYNVGFSVPQHVSDFYKQIFNVVTFTHDRSKGIEKRQSFSNLDQSILENVFMRFCFETYIRSLTLFDKSTFIEILKISLSKNNLDEFKDFNKLIRDYTEFACLIILDGLQYTFIHKSIQEYYTSKFICCLPENLAEKVITSKRIKFYDNSINNFIELLNPYYYNLFNFKSLKKISEKYNIEYNQKNENLIKFSDLFTLGYDFFNEKALVFKDANNDNNLARILFKKMDDTCTYLREKTITESIFIYFLEFEESMTKEKLIEPNNLQGLLLDSNEFFSNWIDICNLYHSSYSYIQSIHQTLESETEFDF